MQLQDAPQDNRTGGPRADVLAPAPHADPNAIPVGLLLKVLRSYKQGDFSVRMPLDLLGPGGEVAQAVNDAIERNAALMSEIARLNAVVGKEGRLDQRAAFGDAGGGWRSCVESLNGMIDDLTRPTAEVGRVIRAVASGNLELSMALEIDGRPLKGEFVRTAMVVNGMVDQLNAFASEVTRVAREVGTEGKLGGQAVVRGVAGTWKDLTDNVNSMASNLTSQVRNIAEVTTAVASGDLSRKITVDVKGELRELKNTINTMVDQLNAFASEVTRVAREVGTEGKLGGQAEVKGVAGTWKDLTDNVNSMASNLTSQVRSIGDVATSVTNGDLTRTITVAAFGEVAALKDNVNEMIRALRETTQKTTEQDWLKTQLARFTRMLQGQRDLVTVARQVLSELAPLVGAQYGAFYVAEQELELEREGQGALRLLASYAYKPRRGTLRFKVGENIVGQCALEKRKILMRNVPPGYVRISSGLGESAPADLVVLPVLFEGQVNAVIELASIGRFSEIHLVFLDQLTESVGLVVNTISASMRTEALLKQSQSLTHELQAQQEELRQTNERLERQARSLRESEERLRQQQEELQQTNEQLEEKAAQLEAKNREVGFAKREVEDQAEQLALTSKYKSQFLANMSHELRTPLNSLLILSRMLSDNVDGNLTSKQIDFARTIHGAGTDLLVLINDILDLSKIESGTMTVDIAEVSFVDLRDHVEQAFRHVAAQKGLELSVQLATDLPASLYTDVKRLQQVLKNLLSNAIKFTERGTVSLAVQSASGGWGRDQEVLNQAGAVIAFRVKDTGIGISQDKQSIIFEAFQQADGTTSRKYGGTGLGLSISRELARLLGGEVRVVSVAGEGSVFTLFLPLSYVAPPVAPPARSKQKGQRVRTAIDAAPRPADSVALSWARIDDREHVEPGDRTVLIIEEDEGLARVMLEGARASGWRGVVAAESGHALALSRRVAPSAIFLDLQLPDTDGWVLLDQFKHDPSTRHVPVQVVAGAEVVARRARRLGACGALDRALTPAGVTAALERAQALTDTGSRSVLVVDGNEAERRFAVGLLGAGKVTVTALSEGSEMLARVRTQRFECVVLGMQLADQPTLDFLERLPLDGGLHEVPIVLYVHSELTIPEERRLAVLRERLVLVDARSPEHLVEAATLYLHEPTERLPEPQRWMLEGRRRGAALAGMTVLVVDDDVRNIFAVTSALERHEAKVLYAEDGTEALALLERHTSIDVVLTDIMMPEMDGYEVMRRIREQERFRTLPIIALTARAMKSDRDKCIEAGASDYIAKPVDMAKLVSMIRVATRR